MPNDHAEILEVLACPRCKGRLTAARNALDCDACGLRYPIREGIPVLLLDEATDFDPRAKST